MDVTGDTAYPALGFDPAPGSPAALAEAADRAVAVGRVHADAAVLAARLDAGWTGPAADAFRARLRDLPRDLERAAAAHEEAGSVLAGYGAGLALRQRWAGELERRAAELRRQRAAAMAAGVTGVAGVAGLGAGSAQARAAWCTAELDQVVAEAGRVRGEHHAAARAAAARIRAAAVPPYPEPGLLARVGGAVRAWIGRHAGTLTSVATVLRGVSAGLGVLCLVPGFGALAPLALGAAGLALGLDAAVRAATGRGSWASLGLDAVLTALPAGPVARAVRAAPGVGRLLYAANRAIPAAVKGRAFRALGTLPEGITHEQLRRAAARIRTSAGHLGDDVVVQGSRAGHSARPASDVDFGIRVPPERYAELVRDCFDPVRNAEARAHAVERGRIFWRHAGLAELRRGLREDVGHRVDLAVIERGGRFDGEPWLPVR
jgi:hypothetical protein